MFPEILLHVPLIPRNILYYYTEESVLLGTKPLVDSIHHFIRDPSGVFSVCHLCECRIVQWRHDSYLLLLLNWFLHIIKRTSHVGSKMWILCSRGKNNISLEHKLHIFSPPCNTLYIFPKIPNIFQFLMVSHFYKFYLAIHSRENHPASTKPLFRLLYEWHITSCSLVEISVDSVRVKTSLVCFILK